jgi:hypothetical protein
MPPSTIEPLPYFPNLHRHIRSVTASLVLTYLEIHHPAPPDPCRSYSSAPVTLDLDAVAADLQVSRRTLLVSLSILSAWWPEEMARCSAARAGREFLNHDHSRYGVWKYFRCVYFVRVCIARPFVGCWKIDSSSVVVPGVVNQKYYRRLVMTRQTDVCRLNIGLSQCRREAGVAFVQSVQRHALNIAHADAFSEVVTFVE